MKNKSRIDLLLVERGLFASREKAQAAIMAHRIRINHQPVTKAGTLVTDDVQVEIVGDEIPYVSRGGLKLQKALEVFEVSVQGKKAVDIGASTGGFTDCLLQHGASRVWAIDVGYGQLAWKIRTDNRVTLLERTNIRTFAPEQLGDVADIAVIDVSFISLTLVLPVVSKLLVQPGDLIALVKPQFEAGPKQVGSRGVIRDTKVHQQVIARVIANAQAGGWQFRGLTFSPLRGREGNTEFLLWLDNRSVNLQISPDFQQIISHTVDDACEYFSKDAKH